MTCFFTIPANLIPLQFCSMEVDTEGLAVMGATLANGGICPTTGEKVLSASSVRDTLSLMYSCGMYNYSGNFAFRVRHLTIFEVWTTSTCNANIANVFLRSAFPPSPE